MKRTTLFVAATIMLSATTHIAVAQNGDDIINKHIEAIGGEAAWSKVKSVRMSGTASAMGMEMPLTITILDKKAMRSNMSVMGTDGFAIMTEKGGWMYLPVQPGMDKVTPIPEGQMGGGKGGLNYKKAQLAEKTDIASAKYIGNDTLDNVPCMKVAIKSKANEEATAYFDVKTYYLVRMEVKAKAGDEETEVAFSFSNFQKRPEGIVVPMTQSSAGMGGDLTIKTFEVNPQIPDNYFDAEAAAAALKAGKK